MEKEAFLENRKFIESEIEKMKTLKKELEAEYVECNKRFNLGDRIKKVRGQEFGYITGFKIDWHGNIAEHAVKEKKDGTPSKHSMFIYQSSEIESAPKE